MSDLFPVTTNQLELRPFTEADREARFILDCDPDIQKYLGQRVSRQLSAVMLQRDIDAFERDGYGALAVVERHSGRLIGYAGLQKPDWEERPGLEVFVAMASEVRRQGFGTEAASALINIGCTSLDVGELVARVDPGNTPSVGLVSKLGMKPIGERPDSSGVRQVIYAIQCLEWVRGRPTRS